MPELTTDDRLAIAEIMAAYCFAIDQGRWETLPALFTEDCRLDFGEVMGVFEGHAGLERFAGMLRSTGLVMRHYSTNLLLHAVGGGARAESYVLALTGPSSSRRQSTGRYEDELVKVDGRWRIRVRRAIIEV